MGCDERDWQLSCRHRGLSKSVCALWLLHLQPHDEATQRGRRRAAEGACVHVCGESALAAAAPLLRPVA